jgi:hypothetical protein
VVSRPLARSQNLIVEELGEELLVYDTEADRGHCLSPEAARVWRRCDGHTPSAGLSAQLELDADTVNRALDELDACNLLEAAPQLTVDGGTTRRELTVKMVKVGGAVAAAPLIVSIAAPTAASAFTPPPGCEAITQCLFNCGQTGSGCQGAACVCCQLDQCKCNDTPGCICPGTGKVSRPSNVKFCNLGTAAQCPPSTDPCLCTTPCPASATSKPDTTGQTYTQPSTTTPAPGQTYTTPGTTTPAPGTAPPTTTTTPGTTTPAAPPSTGSATGGASTTTTTP